MYNEKYKFDITVKETCLPLLNVSLSGIDEKLWILIDTGSELTLFDDTVVSACLSEGQHDAEGELSISFLSGEMNKNSHSVSLLFDVENYEGETLQLELSGYTADLSNISKHMKEYNELDGNIIGIIGSDYLESTEAKIDYKTGYITIDPYAEAMV